MKRETGKGFMTSLSVKEKAALFDKIAENYFDANFGSLSKSQIELLMFSIYLDTRIDKNKSFDDYTISKELGIGQATVRNLKKKKQLIYPREYDWRQAFLEYTKFAIFDGSGRIVISVPDPNVYIELQNAIEELGGYVDVQLNSKVLKIPPGYFLELLMKLHQQDQKLDEKTAKKLKQDLIKELNARFLDEDGIKEQLTERTLPSKLKAHGLELGMELLGSLIPGGGVLVESVADIAGHLFNK